MNVRGIRKTQRTPGLELSIFHRWMRTQTSGIIALQELQLNTDTFPDNDLLDRLKTALGAQDAIWTPYCALLLSDPTLSFTSHTITTNQRAIFALIHSTQTQETFSVCCIYAPAQHRPRQRFYQSLLQKPFFSNPNPTPSY